MPEALRSSRIYVLIHRTQTQQSQKSECRKGMHFYYVYFKLSKSLHLESLACPLEGQLLLPESHVHDDMTS